MKKTLKAEITKRFVAAGLLTAAVVGVSALAMHAPSHNQNSAARLKSIQTDKTTLFYADNWILPDRCRYVERTGETRLSAENLKLIAAAF